MWAIRIVLSSREMGRIDHATGVQRLMCNPMWKDRPQPHLDNALEWRQGWRLDKSLQQG